MAVAAFKSSSRKGASTNPPSSSGVSTSGKDSRQGDDSPKKVTLRRSRSVSASSRSGVADISADFSNSRDNPLFWSNTSPPSDEVRSIDLKCDEISSRIGAGSLRSMSSGVVENTRGRSVSRNSDSRSKAPGGGKRGGRSLSRVSTERRDRSVSRYPVSSQTVMNSEVEPDGRSMAKSNNRKTPNPVLRGRRESFNFEDRLSSTSSLSEADEKTIKADCEQMMSVKGDCLQGDAVISDIHDIIQYEVRRAIQDIHNDFVNDARSNSNSIASSSGDIPPELVNPGAVELVMDLRSEYAKKLEQSQERCRKLRADLAIEEHRGLELSRILREVIPAPKSSTRRKASIERRKMSKRLTEDALAYFDECVSLSTFDGSDFSSMEEAPPLHQVSFTTQPGDGATQESDIGTSSAINHGCLEQTDYDRNNAIIDHTSLSGPIKSDDGKSQFSFTNKLHETPGIHQDIEKFVQHNEKDGIGSKIVNVNYNAVNLQEPTESLLFNRLLFRNRIESGNLLLCGIGSANLFDSII